MKIKVFKESFERIQADCSVVWVWDKNLEGLSDKDTLQELNFKDITFVQSSKILYVNLAKRDIDLLHHMEEC